MRAYQDLGLPDVADTIRQFMSDPASVAGGAAVGATAAFGSALWDAVTYRWIMAGFTGMWLAWMLLGFFAAMHAGEKLDMTKIMEGVIHWGASVVIFAMGFLIDLMTSGGQPIASAGFGGFMAFAFFAKAASKATYFHAGFREVAKRFLPGVSEGVGTIEETRSRKNGS